MSNSTERCLNCERSSGQIPLLGLKYTGHEYWICPQCLPTLIHKPERLSALAGAWITGVAEHDEG